jgi:acyl-CoA reductase-like NAD-dependent aldehyde dehydrogenase
VSAAMTAGHQAEAGFDVAAGCLVNGNWVAGAGAAIPVLDKYRLRAFTQVNAASAQQVKAAVDAAHAAYRRGAPVAYERGAMLERASALVQQRASEFVRAMVQEAGFTPQDAMGEVRRCGETLRLCAEEARRLAGQVVPMEGAPQQNGRMAFTLRVPLGVVVAITPFNSPLNTVAHKLGPALAGGNAVVLKPSPHTPVTAILLARALVDAGVPAGLLSVLHGGAEVAAALLEDQRVRFFAFTGSTEVGRSIQQAAGLRRTQMELGSIACTIVCDDAKLDHALPRIVNAAYRKAGQVCTSIQLLLVQRGCYEEVQERLTAMVRALPYGDPTQASTVVGPMISEAAARRVEAWVDEAVRGGARKLVGGERQGAVVPPTLLSDVKDGMNVACSEIFGPVMCLMPFDALDEALERVNATPYGLATGLFTNRLGDALKAARELDVGSVHVNETSSSRVDLMPYGGSKDSGFGREGPHFAVHEMTEERVVSFTTA